MSRPLTAEERRALKGRAHALHPVVMIGNEGLTDAVTKEIDASLRAHELIKIRSAGEDRAGRDRLLAEICARTGAAPVQRIGKMLVIFREKPPEPPPAPVAAPRKKGTRPQPAPARVPARPPARPRAPAAAIDTKPSRPGRSPRLLPKRGAPKRSGRR